MRIKEFLRGPLPDDALQEVESKFGGPLTRLYVVGFRGKYVDPDGKAAEVLSKFGLLAEGGGVKACIAGYGVLDGKWRGPPASVVGRYVDVASSDAVFAGAPRGCRSDEAKPAVVDIVRLDVDFHPPKFIVKRVDGKVQVIDRSSGVVLKEFPEEKYNTKRAAKALGVPPGELAKAERWGEDGSVPADILKWQMKLVAKDAARRKLDVRFLLSGAKGFHILLTLERPVPASWRPPIVRKLAEWLNIRVDPATLDPARKLRVPWTVHTETGRTAVFVDPYTLEPVEFDWPEPMPYSLAKTLAALGMSTGLSAPPGPKAAGPKKRRKWVPYLEAVAAANPGLKTDCRKRFSALFGCGCAVDGLDANACAAKLAAALGMGELAGVYVSAMERAYKACAERIAEGQPPLFSIRNALTLDVGEGKGKVWYSIRECITAKPPAVLAEEREEEPPPAEEAEPAEAEAPPAAERQQEAVSVVGVVEVGSSGLVESSVGSPPVRSADLEEHAANVGTVLQAGVDAGLGRGGLTALPLAPAYIYNIENGASPLAENSKAELDSAGACLANPICTNRLKLCIWKHLRARVKTAEETKAAARAEIERRGELFNYCLKDAIEYARREAEL